MIRLTSNITKGITSKRQGKNRNIDGMKFAPDIFDTDKCTAIPENQKKRSLLSQPTSFLSAIGTSPSTKVLVIRKTLARSDTACVFHMHRGQPGVIVIHFLLSVCLRTPLSSPDIPHHAFFPKFFSGISHRLPSGDMIHPDGFTGKTFNADSKKFILGTSGELVVL